MKPRHLLPAAALLVSTLTWSADKPTPMPASMEDIAIQSSGSRMNGLLYQAPGAQPKPVVIFLHGFPGTERNLDLAQAVRRAGYQALYFNYRGSWGSAGTFTFAGGPQDTAAVLAWVRDPANATKYRLDASRIALVGHSYGGWTALYAGAREQPAVCVAALAAWNLGWAAQHLLPKLNDDFLADFRNTAAPDGGPLHASADGLLQEMTAHATDWDYMTQAPALKSHALLLVSAKRDGDDGGVARHAELAQAVKAAGGKRVTHITYDDDHPFSAHRLELAQVLVKWLKVDCAKGQ